jgi:serine/threonine-protein kinase
MTEQLNGRYVIERFLGQGGMGEVFAGHSIGLEGFSRPVAIKRIHSQYSDDRALRPMLVAEARLTARLSHGNIVAVHDLDQDETGRLFLVMELVDGTDLASLLRTGALPWPIALFITCEILRGLGHAHDPPASDDAVRGLVHRDVSPQNVLIGWDGSAKVTDFGLAKARVTTKASASLWTKGKPGYVSPEQANGDALDRRSDLFSAGIMLWEMICGARLFGRGTLEATLRGVLLDPIPSPRSRASGLPDDIERITTRLLERDRSRRYPTAGAAIEALLACAAYPKNGRELVSALLRERLPARARRQSAGGARPPDRPSMCSLDEETTSAPPVAPLRAHGEPYPDPPGQRRARRVVLLALMAVATALVTILALRSLLRVEDDEARAVPAARVAPPSEPRMDQRPRPQDETRAIAPASAPLQAPPVAAGLQAPPVAAAPAPPAPTSAPQPPPMNAVVGRVPARSRHASPAPRPEPANRNGIRVLDLRDLAPMPAGPEGSARPSR